MIVERTIALFRSIRLNVTLDEDHMHYQFPQGCFTYPYGQLQDRI